MPDDPNWPRASSWLAAGGSDIALLGAPIRLGSISGGRFDLAPAAVRGALDGFGVWDGERDLRPLGVRDLGDLDVAGSSPAEAFDGIAAAVREAVASASHGVTVLLGGDNSITRPAAHGVAADLERLGLMTLDAHHDLRDTDAGMLNGNPVRALLEDGLPGANVWQIGIQPFANAPAYAAVARREGVQVRTVDDVRARGIDAVMREALDALASRCEVIYVDLDVDVLDRAFAPGCPGSRPGGLMPWELHRAASLAGAHPKVAAVDIVEVDPERDVANVTVMNAAACLLRFASGVIHRVQKAQA